MGNRDLSKEKKKAVILLKQGLTQKKIASILNVTAKTVRVWGRDLKAKANTIEKEKKMIDEIKQLKKENAELKRIIANKKY
jgi:transposase-like protein